MRIFNNVIRQKGKDVYQSFYLACLFGHESNGFMNHLQVGFLNAVHYVQVDDNDWKMSELHFMMVYETGNTAFVSDNWKMLDYGLFNGSELQCVHRFRDAPWCCVPQNEIVLSDEEQIRQCFFHYTWSIDLGDFATLLQLTTENCYKKEKGQKSREEWISWLREKRPKEATWNHLAHFDTLEVEGDKAYAKIYRYEPNRIGTRFLHIYNLNTIFYSSFWEVGFLKIDGVWKMDTFSSQAVITEFPNQVERYY